MRRRAAAAHGAALPLAPLRRRRPPRDRRPCLTLLPPPSSLFLPSVGVFKNGRVEIIPNDQGNRITPSYVAFTEEGERLIGDAAKNQLTSNPENTVR